MVLSLGDRLRAGMGSAREWLDDRNADLARKAAEWEGKGHRFYGEANRGVRQVMAHAKAELGELAQGAQPEASSRRKPRAQSAVAHTRSSPRRDFGQQLVDNAQRLTTQAQQRAREHLQRVAGNPLGRRILSDAALRAGNIAGVITGGLQTAEDVKDGAILFARLLDVTDPYRHPRGEAAWDQVAAKVGGVVDAATDAFRDPMGAARSGVERGRQMRRNLDPGASAKSSTALGELRRNFEIGRNQGKLAVEVAPYAVGAGELKVATGLGAATKASRVARYIDQGFSEAKAAHLADPYIGRGHHAILPQRARLPLLLGGGPYPRFILDSPFNVLKPTGISRGDFYTLHSQVDPSFYGTGFPRRLGRGGWSSKRLGIEKYRAPQRIYYGTPGATKAVVGGTAIAGGGYVNEFLQGEQDR